MSGTDSASIAMPSATDGLAWIPAQTFTMGSDQHYPEEAPAHRVSVDGFWIETHQVTNAQFEAFVDATGYVSVAERPLDPADFPGAPEENLQPGSMVFTRTAGNRHARSWQAGRPRIRGGAIDGQLRQAAAAIPGTCAKVIKGGS